MSLLGSPMTFTHSGKVARTRSLKSAMTERLCTYDKEDLSTRGKPTPEYIQLYKTWGEGRIGCIVSGNIPVDRTALEYAGNAIIDPKSASAWDPVAAFKPVVEAAKAHGSLFIGQLTHAGRQTPMEVNDAPVSSGDRLCPPAFGSVFAKPRPMTIAEIDELVQGFKYAAEVLYKAGADGIQLHCAHGYLLSQFLSGAVNNRTDDYGGSLENRARVIFRILDEVKKVVPKSFLLGIKINSADFQDGGLTNNESKQVIQWLDEAGVDLIEASGGVYESGLDDAWQHKSERTRKREAYFVEFAESVKPHIRTAKLCTTGGFRSRKAMEEALTGATDIVGLARPIAAEPHLIKALVEGTQQAARENKMANALTTPAAVTQIHQIAKGEPIADLADDETVKALVAKFTA